MELCLEFRPRVTSVESGQKKCGAARRMTERPRCSPQNSE